MGARGASGVSRKLAVASVIWTIALLASRVIGLARESVLGATLGVSATADVYAAAFRVPDGVSYIIAGQATSILFVPMFSAFFATGEDARAWRAFSNVANTMALAFLVVAGAVWVAMPTFADALGSGFTPENVALLTWLSRIMLPAQIFHVLGGMLNAALMARDRHTIPAVAPLVYTSFVIAGGLATGTAEGFAWGVLTGAFVGSFLLPLAANLRAGMRWHPTIATSDPDFRRYLTQAVPVMLALGVVSFDDFTWTYFASPLGEGKVAILNYAKTLMKVPMGVFGFALAVASYPTVSRLVATGHIGEAYAILHTSARRAVLLALASQVALTVAGAELATLVLGTRRIAAGDMAELGVCLAMFSIALAAWTAQGVLARGFYALGLTWLPARVSMLALLLGLPVYALLGARFGAPGLAAASSVAMIAYVAALAALLRWRMRVAAPDADLGPTEPFLAFVVRAAPPTLLAIAIGLVARHGLLAAVGPASGTRVDALLRVLALAAVCAPAWLAASWMAKVPELDVVVAAVRRRVARPQGR